MDFLKIQPSNLVQAQQISPGRYEIEITGTQSGTAQIGVMVKMHLISKTKNITT